MINMSSELITVVLLGVSFFLVITPFQTGSMIQQVVTDSISQDNPNIKWNGYYSLCIIYFVFSMSNWIAPSTVSFIGCKWSMVFGALTYCLFVANFLYPLNFGLYTVSAILGVGAAVIWTAQGNYLTINSSPDNVSRNAGIFWAIFQCSLLFGNLFVFFQFKGEKVISKNTRLVVYGVLTVVGLLGTILMVFLRGVSSSGITSTPKQAFLKSVALLKSSQVWGLCLTFFFTGLYQSFILGVYGTTVGNTEAFDDSKKLIGISGMLLGLGEITGGTLFGLLGGKFAKNRRDTIVIFGFIIQIIALAMIYFNMPFESSIRSNNSLGIISPAPNLYLALTSSFLLGFGDACFITQIMAFLSSVFYEDSAPIFALFKFTQSIASAAAFFYSNSVGVDVHVYVLAVGSAIGAISFCVVEMRQRMFDAEKNLGSGKVSPGTSSTVILTSAGNTN